MKKALCNDKGINIRLYNTYIYIKLYKMYQDDGLEGCALIFFCKNFKQLLNNS